jgi:hypothetical protein
LDIVEGSATSETEKDAAYGTGAGNVEAPASTARERERERERERTLDDGDTSGSPGNLEVNRSGRAGLKEGVVVAVGE